MRQIQIQIQAAKFTLVGAANFVLTFVIFTVLLKLVHLHYLFSLMAAWLAGMVLSYVVNFTWVFPTNKPLQFRVAFLKFFLASSLSVALNLLALRFLVEATGFDPFLVQLALIPFVVVFNFTTAKYWSLQ